MFTEKYLGRGLLRELEPDEKWNQQKSIEMVAENDPYEYYKTHAFVEKPFT
jgi:hypothetical protein